MAFLLRSTSKKLFTNAAMMRSTTLKNNLIKSAPVYQFHSTSFKRDEEKKTPVIADTLEKKESNWGVMTPLGLALTIPVLSNGMYVINEETQLACCFMLFCASVYKYGGEMIGSYFDAKADAILREHNAIEDSSIEIAKEALATHRTQLNLVDDINAIHEAHQEAVALLCHVEAQKVRHEMRDVIANNLEAIVSYEKRYAQKMQNYLVERTSAKVRQVVAQGGPLKEDAFSNALRVLSNQDTADKDDVVDLYCTTLRECAEEMEKENGTTMTLSSVDVDDLQKELDSFAKRHDMDSLEMTAPSEVEFKLIK